MRWRGLLLGCVLVLGASRDYLLGFPGIAVSSFLALLLATFAGLTLYIAGFAQGVVFGANLPVGRHHLAVALALAGVLAAFLLIATPWSPYRKVAQPWLAAIAVASPALALFTLSGMRAFAGGFGSLPLLGGDPVLVLASVAGLLAIPLAVASSIEWVAGCVGAGFWVTALLAARPAWSRVVISAEVLWLALGMLGWLPAWLGGRLSAWDLVRSAHLDAWLLAVVLTAMASLFIAQVRGRLDLAEAASASYVPTALLFYSSLAGGLFILLVGVRLVVLETVPAALPAIVACICMFVLAVALLWFKPGRGRHFTIAIIAAAAGCTAIIAAGLLWPVAAVPNQLGVALPLGLAPLGRTLGSATVLAVGAGWTAMVCLGAWAIWVMWARLNPVVNVDGTPAAQTGYETVVLPLGCWSLVLAGAAVLRMTKGVTVSAFTTPVLPDPVLFTVVAVPFAAVVAITRLRVTPGAAHAALTVVLVMPVLAFLPFAIPAQLGPAGRLAVLAVAAPIIYGLTLGGARLGRTGGARRLCWLAGTSAIVVPLLAYLAVIGGPYLAIIGRQRGSLTSLLIDTGQAGAGTGLGAHLRLVLLLPLLVTFVSAKSTPSAERRKKPPRSRWRDFQADILIYCVRDEKLDEIYLDRLRRHLAALTPEERAKYALELAKRLGRPYRQPQPGQPVRPPGQVAPVPDYPQPEAVKVALRVATQRLHGQKPQPGELAHACSLVAGPFRPPAPNDRRDRRAFDALEALRCALDCTDSTPACLDALITASKHEVEDSAERLINGRHGGRAYERNLARARSEIDRQLASLQKPFTLFEVPVKLVWSAPAMVLNDPAGVRQGVDLPVEHPYRYLGAALTVLGVVAAISYFHLASSPPPTYFHLAPSPPPALLPSPSPSGPSSSPPPPPTSPATSLTQFKVCISPAIGCTSYGGLSRMKTEPTQIVTTGDSSGYVKNLTWSGWGSASARGTGILELNNCNPNCARGTFTGYPATVTLSGLTGYGHGQRAYSIMVVSAPSAPGPARSFTTGLVP